MADYGYHGGRPLFDRSPEGVAKMGSGSTVPNATTIQYQVAQVETTDVILIWVREDKDAIWLFGAWDEVSAEDNSEGYEKALADAIRAYGKENTVIVRTKVDFGAVQAEFDKKDEIPYV